MAAIPRLVILGSAAVVPDAEHENTHMLLQGENSAILVDVTGRPLVSLKKIGVGVEDLTDVILTHFHPDHVGAFPNLLLSLWLVGRSDHLRVYGLHHCLERVEDLMTAFHWEDWAGFFAVSFHHLPEREGIMVLENNDFRITAAPVRHYVPTIGIRVLVKQTKFVFAYSSDTVPCPEMVRLAEGADLLIHEAAGDEPLGHSSAAQAGAIAREAGVKALGLIHYPVWESSSDRLIGEAKATFDGEVFLCEDGMELSLGV